MAGKKRTPNNQLTKKADAIPTYDEMTGEMISETTGIISDFYRQYIGVYGSVAEKPGDAIFVNWDPVLKEETYKRWAQYDLYWYLEQDPHIRAILSASKVNVAGLAYLVKPYLKGKEKKPSATNEAIADFVQSVFEGMETFPQHLFDLMDALPKGFSFSEIIWILKNGYWTINNLMNRPQRRIQFDAVTRQPRIRTVSNPFYGDRIEPGKYIVHRVSSNWENPFGDAIDQSLYWTWLFKRTAIKFALRHLETGASSIPIVQIPAGAGEPLKKEGLYIAQMIHNGAFGYIPENFSILYAEAKNILQSAEAFQNFIRLMNDEMTKSVKGQLLTTEGSSSAGTGSKAMGQTHKITEDQYDIFRAKGLAASINKYLVKFLVDYNFSNVDGYPRFTFDVEEEEDLKTASEVLGNLTKALPGYEVDIEQVNEKFGYMFTKSEKKAITLPIGQQKFDEKGNPIVEPTPINKPITGEPK